MKPSRSQLVKRLKAARARREAAETRDTVIEFPRPALAVDNTKKLRIPRGAIAAPRRTKLTDTELRQMRADSFRAPEVPPGVGPQRQSTRIAMDSNVEAYNGWAAQANYAYNFAFTEGVTFLGYTYLAELAQRSEYRQIVETISEECTRKWIKFASSSEDKNKDDKIKELTDAVDAFKVRDRAFDFLCVDGYFGRSHIYIDTGDTDNPNELAKSLGNGRDRMSQAKMRKGKLRGFKIVEPVWTYPESYDSNNPLTDNWYNPQQWFVMSNRVHVSRLLRVVAREVPDILKPSYSFGGLSMTQIAKPYVENWLRTRQSVSDLIHSYSTNGLKTDLSTSLQGDGSQLFDRAALFNNFRDNSGLMILNKDTEEFFNVSVPLSTLDALQAQSQEQMCSVTRIPVVKLLGIQPSGLNASSQGELDSFEDHIHAYQERVMRTPLTKMIDFIQLTLWGAVDQDITFSFEPLEEMSEKERAEIQKMKAEVDDLHINAQTISPEEARTRIASDPDSGYEGLDPLDMPEPPDEQLDVGPEGEQEGGEEADPFAQDEENFKESEHPRDHGKFTSKGGGGGASVTAKVSEQALKENPGMAAYIASLQNSSVKPEHQALVAEVGKVTAKKLNGGSAERTTMRKLLKEVPSYLHSTKQVLQKKILESFSIGLSKASGPKADELKQKIKKYEAMYGASAPLEKPATVAQANVGYTPQVQAEAKAAMQSTGVSYTPAETAAFNDLCQFGGVDNAKDWSAVAKSKLTTIRKHNPDSAMAQLSVGEASHIVAYTGNGYKKTNSALRRGVMTKDILQHTRSLNAALDKLEPYTKTTYRKTDLTPAQAALYEPGSIVVERGFTSSSKNKGVWSGDYHFEIQGKSGRDVEALSKHDHEEEVLFKSNSCFEVVSRSGNKITLREV